MRVLRTIFEIVNGFGFGRFLGLFEPSFRSVYWGLNQTSYITFSKQNKNRSKILQKATKSKFVNSLLAIGMLCLLTLSSPLAAKSITGFWRSINEVSGLTQCIIAVYEYDGLCYGRIVGTCNTEGKVVDTIYAPKGRAPGINGTPFYAGLDLVWNLYKKGSRYKGKIVDPEKGRIYDAKLWVEEGNLIVRGELLIFGKSVTWMPALESDFSTEFPKPDVTKFVPSIPLVN